MELEMRVDRVREWVMKLRLRNKWKWYLALLLEIICTNQSSSFRTTARRASDAWQRPNRSDWSTSASCSSLLRRRRWGDGILSLQIWMFPWKGVFGEWWFSCNMKVKEWKFPCLLRIVISTVVYCTSDLNTSCLSPACQLIQRQSLIPGFKLIVCLPFSPTFPIW